MWGGGQGVEGVSSLQGPKGVGDGAEWVGGAESYLGRGIPFPAPLDQGMRSISETQYKIKSF